MKSRIGLAVVTCILLAAAILSAQQAYYGSIVGNVSDPTGAMIPNASVTVTNVGTGITIELAANELGIYQALNLNTGAYSVKVTAPGFVTFVREKIMVAGGQQVRIDAGLTLGSVDQSVEVRGASPLINTENATTIIGAITHYQTVTLPNAAFAPACPGCDWPWPDVYTQLWFGNADVNNSAYNIGGALSNQNAQIDDGMRTEGTTGPYAVPLTHPGLEAVEEMVVTTSNPSAKYHNPAAIELVLKSGTNSWHGSGWWNHGNKSLNAAGYLTHKKLPFLENQYGASLGGPLIKNKTFFFFDYQGFKYDVLRTYLISMPTAKMKSGDLSELLDPAVYAKAGYKSPLQIVDPLTGKPFPDNQIPAQRISSVAKSIVPLYPDPNQNSGRAFFSDYMGSNASVRREKLFDVRVDHYFTPTQHLYGRFTFLDSPNSTPVYEFLPPFRGGDWLIIKGRIFTLHHASTITPHLLNHAMFGFYRNRWPSGGGLFEQNFTAWNQKVGIAGIPANQDNGIPLMSFSQTGFSVPASWGKSERLDQTHQFQDDITWSRGRHSIQTGFDFRRNHEGNPVVGESWPGYCQFGCIRFNGRWTGFDFADFLLGLPLSATRAILPPVDFRNRTEWAGYIQDDIKWTPKLSLSLGLRYSYFPVVRSENDMQALFDPATGKLVLPSQKGIDAIPKSLVLPIAVTTASAVGLPSSLLRSDKDNWQPRLGVAYRFMKNSVVRAGAGVYRTPLVATGRSLLAGPFSVTQDFPAAQPGPNDQPVLNLANPYATSGNARALTNFFAPETHLNNDLHYDFNLAVERQIGANTFVVEYVGKRAIVPYSPQLNAVPASSTPFNRNRLPFPQLGSVAGLANGAHYNYNGLRINARRTFTRGLHFDATYVFSKTIDDLGGINGETAAGPEDPFNRARDRGRSSFMPANRLTLNYIWAVPFGGSRLAFSSSSAAGRVVNQVIKGWQLAGNFNLQGAGRGTPTGSYINAAGQVYDAPNTNKLSGRPDATGQSLEATADQKSKGFLFNPDAFTRLVPPGRYGNAGKTVIPMAGKVQINMSFFRTFALPNRLFFGSEHASLRIGALAYNAINHSSRPGPTVNLNSSLFGKRPYDKNGDTRTIGLQARIDF